ncbi:unnamed protein product [Dibothriocephalus latus]|uniref:Uncharacterized protein n=1 Tax=Dibothriocephalus latus TaxID=60516 RepID=A0A3P7LMW7_DIBLA|nr:unnamed protein product [Dibothriocephalus latus]
MKNLRRMSKRQANKGVVPVVEASSQLLPGTRMQEHKAAARRLDLNSQLATHIGETGLDFDIQGTTTVGQGASKAQRWTLEAWYSDAQSVNRHLAFPAAYKVLRHYRIDKERAEGGLPRTTTQSFVGEGKMSQREEVLVVGYHGIANGIFMVVPELR